MKAAFRLISFALGLFFAVGAWALELPWEKESASPRSENTQPVIRNSQAKVHCLIIGVGLFQNPKITPLQYAASDARNIYNYLATSVDRKDMMLLVDSDATAQKVRRALDSIADRIKPYDTVIVYVSTHTYPRTSQLVLHDTDISSAASRNVSSLTPEMLKSFAGRIGQAGLIILIDAGYRREAAMEVLGGNLAVFQEQGNPRSRLLQKSAKVMVFSTGSAWESDVLRSSYFTYYYLEGLKRSGNAFRPAFHYAAPIITDRVKHEKNAEQILELLTTDPDWSMAFPSR